MNKEADWVVIGRLGRPQGLKGLIRVISFTDPETAILDYQPWFVQEKQGWSPLKLELSQIQNKIILVKVAGCTERETVAQLTNRHIAVRHAQLPELADGEYYWHELKQMHVKNQNGVLLGKVVDILPTGSHDVLVIQGNKRHLIPYVTGMYIVEVDPKQRQIVVDWDEHF